MSLTVFLAVLGAAALHAAWNALIKVGVDRFSSILLLALVQSGLALALLPFFPLPAPAAIPWITAAALLHTLYKLSLIRAYEHGDLSQVYPVARGTAPLLVAVAGSLLLGETLELTQIIAIVAIGSGVILMGLKGGSAMDRMRKRALVYALTTALCTASYTLADAHGARLALTASGFAMWMFVCDGLAMMAYALVTRGSGALRALRPGWRSGLLAGAFSLGSYWIAIWAFTRAPIALVAALRETSVLFAMLIGVAFLRERALPWRWAAAALIVAGVLAMHA